MNGQKIFNIISRRETEIKTKVRYHRHPPECLKFKKSDKTQLMSMWSPWNSHTPLVGMQSVTTTLENRLAVSSKVESILSIPSSNPILIYLPPQKENMRTYKDLYSHSYSCFINIVKNRKQLKNPSAAKQITKLWTSHPQILLNNRKANH